MFKNWSKEKKLEAYRELGAELERIEREDFDLEDVEPVAIADSFATYKTRKQIAGLKTNFAALDQTFEGLQKGSLYVVGGSTGAGKTLFVANIALQAALAGNQTLFLTTEMPHHEVTGRLRRIWNGMLADDDNFNHLPIAYVDNRVGITTGLIRRLLEKNREEAKSKLSAPIELVIIDNLQWFCRGGANMSESIGLATGEIKKMAIEFDLPIILVSHLNRLASSQESPDLSTLKNSSYIEQDADGVILLWRDTKGIKYFSDVIMVSVEKNRLTGELRSFALVADENLLLKKAEYNEIKK